MSSWFFLSGCCCWVGTHAQAYSHMHKRTHSRTFPLWLSSSSSSCCYPCSRLYFNPCLLAVWCRALTGRGLVFFFSSRVYQRTHTRTRARTFTHFVVKRKIIIMLNSHSSLAGCHATPGIRTSVAHGPPLGTVRITGARLFGVGTVQHYQGCHTAVSLLEGTKASLWQRSVALAAHANGTRSVITSRCASLAIGVHCEFGQPHKSTQFVNY